MTSFLNLKPDTWLDKYYGAYRHQVNVCWKPEDYPGKSVALVNKGTLTAAKGQCLD